MKKLTDIMLSALLLSMLTVSTGTAQGGKRIAGPLETALGVALKSVSGIDYSQKRVVFAMSKHDCLACNSLAVNAMLRQCGKFTSANNIVVIIEDGDEEDMPILSKKLQTQNIVLDTASMIAAALPDARFTEMFILAPNGNVINRISHLQDNPAQLDGINTGSGGSNLFQGRVSDETDKIKVAFPIPYAPETAATQHVEIKTPIAYIGQLIDDQQRNRVTVADLGTGDITTFNLSTGEQLSHIELPDMLRFYFRKDSTDETWRGLLQLGYDPAHIGGIAPYAGSRDTLIALAQLLSGHHPKRTLKPGSTTDTIEIEQWEKREVVARIVGDHYDMVRAIAPECRYTLMDLCALEGKQYIGSALWNGFTRRDNLPADSLMVFAVLDADAMTVTPVLPNKDLIEKFSLKCFNPMYRGKTSSLSGGRICYLNQANGVFMIGNIRNGKMDITPIKPGGSLAPAMRIISSLADTTNVLAGAPILVSDLRASGSRLFVLLVANEGTMPRRVVLQRYTVEGEYVSESEVEVKGMEFDKGKIALIRGDVADLLLHQPHRKWITIPVGE